MWRQATGQGLTHLLCALRSLGTGCAWTSEGSSKKDFSLQASDVLDAEEAIAARSRGGAAP
ncbi:MAG: hypothetical protein HY901_32305 [Deltaproteobacteria bacterium]|nr:hypothetical protein [Deltaproteobacteria bacterium]